jgi:urease accessory protein
VRRPGAIRARASLATELHLPAQGAGRTRVSTLRSEAPLILRPALPKAREPWAAHAHDVARVSLAAGAGGPVGGDELHLQVRVGAGSSLVLAEISPTLALPGPHGGQSRLRVDVEVAAGGTLIWLPEPVIAARGCDHLTDVRVELDEQARLFLREELLLGRHGETGGRIVQRVSVRRGGLPLYRADLELGTATAGTPAVAGNHRAIGSTVIVDPGWADSGPPAVSQLPGRAVMLPLAGPAVVVTALADDNLALRHQLEVALRTLGHPWDPAHWAQG